MTTFFSNLGGKISSNIRDEAFKNVAKNTIWLSSKAFYDIILILQYFIFDVETLELLYILPETSIPTHYKLHINASGIPSGSTNFSGEVQIDVLIEQPTYYIMMQSRQQIVDSLQVFYKNGTELTILDYHLYPGLWLDPGEIDDRIWRCNSTSFSADTLTIFFMETLDFHTELIVIIKYSANLQTEEKTGFYQTSYVINGESRFVGATQFKQVGARLAFPHYDEPANKVSFELTITHDSSQHALSNTFGTSLTK